LNVMTFDVDHIHIHANVIENLRSKFYPFYIKVYMSYWNLFIFDLTGFFTKQYECFVYAKSLILHL